MSERAWRIENANRAAWPTRRESVVDGWLVRYSGPQTRRFSNSANPTRDASSSDRVIAHIEAIYRERDLEPLFRLPDMADGLDEALAQHGYTKEGDTLTVHGSLDAAFVDPRVKLSLKADGAWVQAKARFTDGFAPVQFLDCVGAIEAPVRFASLALNDVIVAESYGVVVDRLLVIEAVATDPAFRQRGLAHACITTLMDWAKSEGAEATCLQVEAANTPAVALYRKLGYGEIVYRYHYRRAPKS